MAGYTKSENKLTFIIRLYYKQYKRILTVGNN